MKKRINSRSAFFYLRVSIGMALLLAGVFLTLLCVNQFSANASERSRSSLSINPLLIPPMFDCSQVNTLGYNVQENFRAGAIMIYCGQAQGGIEDEEEGEASSASFADEILAPLLGGTDKDLVTGTETSPHIIQSETFAAQNPDDPTQIVVAYNDSRGAAANPFSFSGASVSTDGGNTFTRLTKTTGQSPFPNTVGDPVVIYNKPTATWFTVWLDGGCGSQGIGGYKTTTPADPNSYVHFCIHTGSSDDRESGWADNNPSSPFYGRMYVTRNDFALGGNLMVRYSTDNGLTWTNERQLAPASPFIRDVQITGDATNGNVYVAGMNEGGGGLANRMNLLYKSTDGGNTWTKTFTSTAFAAPGSTLCVSNSYFACMFTGPAYWRHMGWGQPGVFNNVVHYVYDSRNTTNGDTGDVFYVRSTDGGLTFSAPLKLNTDTTTRPQWQPNLSVGSDGSVVAVWYDARESTTCTKGNSSVPCYRMWTRKSTDNGVTWAPDEPFSDVVSPLPGQGDANIVTEYAGDYDYSFAGGAAHIHPWTDGRVAISSASQQDAFVDQDPIGGGQTLMLKGKAESQGTQHRVKLKWNPSDHTGNINIIRDGVIVATVPDTGQANDNLGTMTGTFSYQVCETDSGDCSNTISVTVN